VQGSRKLRKGWSQNIPGAFYRLAVARRKHVYAYTSMMTTLCAKVVGQLGNGIKAGKGRTYFSFEQRPTYTKSCSGRVLTQTLTMLARTTLHSLLLQILIFSQIVSSTVH